MENKTLRRGDEVVITQKHFAPDGRYEVGNAGKVVSFRGSNQVNIEFGRNLTGQPLSRVYPISAIEKK
jgi:hypothetical protein